MALRMRLLARALALLTLLTGACAIHEKATFVREAFSDGPSFRTDLCDIARR